MMFSDAMKIANDDRKCRCQEIAKRTLTLKMCGPQSHTAPVRSHPKRALPQKFILEHFVPPLPCEIAEWISAQTALQLALQLGAKYFNA